MPRLSDTAVPAYCKHRGSGQTVITLDGRDFYLGKFNSAESKAEYRSLSSPMIPPGLASWKMRRMAIRFYPTRNNAGTISTKRIFTIVMPGKIMA